MNRPVTTIRYAGFISYRHLAHDRHWAMRIMRQLEAFRTPRSLRAQGYPDRLGVIFRDEDEIPASADLSDQIEQALRNSDLLIVICSPDTSASKWVRREIELFQEMGKGDKIVPVLIAGTPEQSFPPELLRRKMERTLPDGTVESFWESYEPFAADVRPNEEERPTAVEERAILRIAATALGCRFDDLAQREARQRQAYRRRIAAIAATVLAVVAGAGGWWWDANIRLKTAFYANYAEHWGVPVGVGLVEGDDASHASTVYRITKRAGQVLELARLNGLKWPTFQPETEYESEDWTRDAAKWVFDYRSDGALSAVRMFTRTGRPLRQLQYRFSEDKRNGVVLFERDLGQTERQSAEGMALGNLKGATFVRRGSVGQHRLTFDTNGLVSERWFEPVGGGSVIADANGAAGRAYRYSAAGLVISLKNLDTAGDVLTEKTGVSEVRRSYDDSGRLINAEWRTKAGDLTQTDLRFARVAFERDRLGRVQAERYFDEDGKLTSRKDRGVAQVVHAFDDRGNLVELAFLGTDGKPVLSLDWNVARATFAFDAHGNAIEHAYFGLDGKPSLRKDWSIARGIFTFDANGNLVEELFFGIDGKPFAKATSVYDARGNGVEHAYFSADGKPMLRPAWGAAKATYAYDARGNLVEQAYYGLDGNLTPGSAWGVAKAVFAFDDRGNKVEAAYFGIDGKPAIRKDWGVARGVFTYDARGNEVEDAYFGVDGAPALRRDLHAASAKFVFDARGNGVEEAYFGLDGKPVLATEWGVARTKFGYDQRGNVVQHSYFGVDGKPILRKDWGAASAIFVVDSRGNIVEEACFGLDGKPTLSRDWGVARVRFAYDARGNSVEESYLGIDGKPMLSKDWGVARWTFAYDAKGNVVEERYFGIDGKPTLRSDLVVAHATYAYDFRGGAVETAYFGLDGKPALSADRHTARIVTVFDDRGGIQEQTYYGVDGQLLENAQGFAKATAKRDEYGRLIEERYFDRNGKPALRVNKASNNEEVEDFGEWRNLVLSGALDQAALAKLGSGGFARIEQTFNPRGRPTRRSFFGVNDEPVAGLNGFPEESTEYDALDRPVLFRPIVESAAVTPVEQVWTRVSYDLTGDVSRIDYVAPDGQIVNGKGGFASLVIETRENGGGKIYRYLDAKGKILEEK